MLVVLIIWAIWLQLDLAHPNSRRRSRVSLAIVIAIGIVLFIAVASGSTTSIQQALQEAFR